MRISALFTTKKLYRIGFALKREKIGNIIFHLDLISELKKCLGLVLQNFYGPNQLRSTIS
jgi:hypothetical protein